MAVAFVRNHTSGIGTGTVSATLAANVPSGNTLILYWASNTASTTTPTVSAISKPGGETASWVKIAEHDGNSADSTRGEMWAITTTQQWNSGTSVTVTVSTGTGKDVALLGEWSGASTTIRSGTAASQASTNAHSVTLAASAMAGDLVLGGVDHEDNAALTPDSDTSNGSWEAAALANTSGGSGASNITAIMQGKVVTASGTQTYNSGPAGDEGGACIVALEPGSGNQTVSPTAFDDGSTLGSPTVSTAITCSPTGIATAEAHGSPTVTNPPPAQTVTPTAIASAGAFGTPSITTAVTSTPTGIATAEAFGTPVRSSTITSNPTAISSAEAFGTPALTIGGVVLSPSAISSAESLGTPVVTPGGVSVSPSSIGSAETFGTVTRTSSISVSPGGISTQESVSSVVISTTVSVSPTGITSAQAFGALTVNTLVSVSPTGIATAELFGTLVVGLGTITVSPSGIATELAFGSVTISIGAVTLSPGGITTSEIFGSPVIAIIPVDVSVFPVGIDSEQSFGTLIVYNPGQVVPFVGWGVPIIPPL